MGLLPAQGVEVTTRSSEGAGPPSPLPLPKVERPRATDVEITRGRTLVHNIRSFVHILSYL